MSRTRSGLPVESKRPPAVVREVGHQAATVDAAAQILLEAPRVAIMSHVRTDGDGVTVWALASALKKLAKRVQVFLDLPPELAWLTPADPELAPAAQLDPATLVVTVDCARYARNAWPRPEQDQVREALSEWGVEEQVPLSRFDAIRPVTLVIDHHTTNRGYGRWNWIEPRRSAAAEMVLDLIQVLQELTGRDDLVDAETARWLMVGLVTSTGWFQHDTDSRTWQAAEWLDRVGGIDKAALAERLNSMSEGYFRLGGALRRLTHMRRGVLFAMIPRRLLIQHDVADSEAARYIDEMAALPASLHVLGVELADGTIRLRLRSRVVRVDELAREFGGGGHESASGTIVDSWAEARRLVRTAERAVSAATR